MFVFHCHVSFWGGDCLVARDYQPIRLLLTSVPAHHYPRNAYTMFHDLCFMESVKFSESSIYLFKDMYHYFYSQTFEGNHATLYGKYTPFTHARMRPKIRWRLWCFVIAVVDSNSFVEMHPLQFGLQVLSELGQKTARGE